MTAHAPDPQDPVQIIARFVRGNWDLPQQVGTGLIEELASEGWIITRAQVFNDMLEALKSLVADFDELIPHFWGAPIVVRNSSIDAARAAISKAERGSDD